MRAFYNIVGERSKRPMENSLELMLLFQCYVYNFVINHALSHKWYS